MRVWVDPAALGSTVNGAAYLMQLAKLAQCSSSPVDKLVAMVPIINTCRAFAICVCAGAPACSRQRRVQRSFPQGCAAVGRMLSGGPRQHQQLRYRLGCSVPRWVRAPLRF